MAIDDSLEMQVHIKNRGQEERVHDERQVELSHCKISESVRGTKRMQQ